MSTRPGSSFRGIIGCLDPGGVHRDALADWSGTGISQAWCGDGAFRLLVLGASPAKAHRICTKRLCGILFGELYDPPSQVPAEKGHQTPVEHLLQAYRRSGPGCLFTLNGQFGVLLWDRERAELILFRDNSGSRSLYFAELPGGGLAFADNLDLLVASPLVEKRLARRSLHEFLRFLDISPPNSIYEGVSSAEPGVLYRMGRALARGQPVPAPPASSPPRKLHEAAAELEEILARAVTARLGTEGATVAFLSGGIDSSLLCQLAADRGEDRIVAVTVAFAEGGFDESAVARRIAGHLGIPHLVLAFPMSAYQDAFEELTSGIEYPSADPAGTPTLLAFQAARDIGPCALDGTGADTLFGIMPARHQRLSVQYGALLPPPWRRRAARGMGAIPLLRRYCSLLDFDDPEEVLIRWRGWSRRELEDLCREPVSLEHTRFYRLFRQFPRHAHLRRYSTLLGNLPDDRIHQAATLTGLEVRFPFFDPRVVTWVGELEPDLRYNSHEPKRLLKTTLANHLPRELWEQPKHGFDFPFLDLMKSDDYLLVRRYLDRDVTERWGLFDREQIQDTKDNFICGNWRSAFATGSPAFKTWALVVLFAWLENHFRHL